MVRDFIDRLAYRVSPFFALFVEVVDLFMQVSVLFAIGVLQRFYPAVLSVVEF